MTTQELVNRIATLEWRLNDHLTHPIPSAAPVYNVAEYGAKGDGSTASAAGNAAAFQAALADAEAARGTIVIPEGYYYYNAMPFDITGTVNIYGAGMHKTVLMPTSGYSGYCIRLNDTYRSGVLDFSNGKYVAGTITGDIHLRDFSIAADRANSANGIRTYKRVDYIHFENIGLFFLKGKGLELGVAHDGVTINAFCRESTFRNIRIVACGDGATPAMHVSTDFDVVGVTANTNNLEFIDVQFVHNYGAVLIRGDNGQAVKRISFVNTLLHGDPNRAAADMVDLMVIEGQVNDLTFVVLKMNHSYHDSVGGTYYSCIEIKDDAGANGPPDRIKFIDVDAQATDGDAFKITKAGDVMILGQVHVAGIGRYELNVAANAFAGTSRLVLELQGSGDRSSTLNIDSSNLGNITDLLGVLGDDVPTLIDHALIGDKTWSAWPGIVAENATDLSGADPNSNVTAEVGTILLYQSANAERAGVAFWVKASGTGNTGWVPAQLVITATQTQLRDQTDQVNAKGKFVGKMIWDSTNGTPVWAAGTGATAVWVDATGATVHTPV